MPLHSPESGAIRQSYLLFPVPRRDWLVVSATKLYLAGLLGRNALLNRRCVARANQMGLLGFGGDRFTATVRISKALLPCF
ncbi:MAG: DUF3034 family protein [Thiobacillus sp.]|nr:DUF3034 family protein [Thiobacillus sp.]